MVSDLMTLLVSLPYQLRAQLHLAANHKKGGLCSGLPEYIQHLGRIDRVGTIVKSECNRFPFDRNLIDYLEIGHDSDSP
ncbi:hypothetical protein D3C81_2185040 [compost metagenome]